MTINIVRGLVDSLQARQQENVKAEDLKNPAKQANNPTSNQNANLGKNVATSDAVVNKARNTKGSNVENERVKDSKGARELAKSIGDKVRGDSSVAKNAHQLSSDSGQALLV